MTVLTLPAVRVAGIAVADSPMSELVDLLSRPASSPVLAFALHVGGLNAAGRPDVQESYAAGDVTYADGAAVVLLGRMAGGRHLDRAPTTDLAPLLLDRLAQEGRRRTFLLGGPPGLAAAAGARLAEEHGSEVVGVMSGYDLDPSAFVAAVWETRPDVVIVGLGAPREMAFLAGLRDQLPPALYLTCGGWFGFVVGEERRAPRLFQRCGLEWVWRLKQHPRRLLSRYAWGAWTTARMALLLTGVMIAGRSAARP
jgi:N-acetylglucosaminyldiphosphoundecaprenol N-acetyl-beta-D-mannosaminyltransferase